VATGTYAAILDADLECQPRDLPRLLDPLLSGRAQAVFGSRAFESHSAYGFWYVLGNKAVTMTANFLYNSWLSDIMTCWKVMPTSLLRSLDLHEAGFAVEPEIAAKLLRSGVRIYEVPISYHGRTYAEGKKINWKDGIAAFWHIFRSNVLTPRAPVYAPADQPAEDAPDAAEQDPTPLRRAAR
jgi:hypothetical protein